MTNADWTDALSDRLKALWAEGLTCSQIGERLGITKNAAIGKIRRMKLPRRRASCPNRVAHISRSSDAAPEFDPNRADKLLRRFSWDDRP